MRVVLDTNILISACWTTDGLEAKLVAMVLSGNLTACLSPAMEAEYRDVLLRPKFSKLHDQARELLARFKQVALLVEPATTIDVASDEDDNRFVECAACAAADYLITGNLRHYPAQWAGTRIVNARGFFDLTEAP